MIHAARYFDRATWALLNATNDELSVNIRSHLTAVAVHACQSLKESLVHFDEENPNDVELGAAIDGLPHTEVIENVRNMDLHGWPLPVCDPNVHLEAMVTKPGKPIRLMSSHGVPVAVTMSGASPKVHNPNRKCANVKFGGATVSVSCDQGRFIVHDFSTNKSYLLLGLIKEFLKACHPIIKNRMPKLDSEADTTQIQAKEDL